MTGGKPELTTVVFDLGGVLIDWNPRHLYRKLFNGNPAQMEWFLREVCTSEWNALQDAGRSFEDAVLERSALFPEHEELIRAYYDRWEEMIGGPIEGTVEILDELRKTSLRLYALTNWSAQTFPVARERFEFLQWFQGIVVSGEIGKIKPGDAIFEHMLDAFSVRAEECVFIDDSAPNVETARQLGFEGIHFEGPEPLRADLEALGILQKTT